MASVAEREGERRSREKKKWIGFQPENERNSQVSITGFLVLIHNHSSPSSNFQWWAHGVGNRERGGEEESREEEMD